MSTPREAFLRQVRQAVRDGNRVGVPGLPDRGGLGYQGGGIDRFRRELAAAGGTAHVVAGASAAVDAVVELVRSADVRRVLLGNDLPIDIEALAGRLRLSGVRADLLDEIPEAEIWATFFAAAVSVTGAAWLIAETGSVVARAAPREPRSASLLPPVHVVVAHAGQLLPDLFDLFEREGPGDLPSCLTLITGPSKTGDVELKLVTGVHGPGEVHVVLIDAEPVDGRRRP